MMMMMMLLTKRQQYKGGPHREDLHWRLSGHQLESEASWKLIWLI